MKLDLDVLVVDLAVFLDVAAQLLEHALHVLRWVETEDTWFKLIKSDQYWYVIILIGIDQFGNSFLIVLFELLLDQLTNRTLATLDLILFLLLFVLKTVSL